MKLSDQVVSLDLVKLEAKPVSRYIGYFVTAKGEVYSTKYGRIEKLKQSEHKGYRRVALSQNNKRRIFPVHRLVAEQFVENKDYKPFVNHKDGNKRNNTAGNLEWCNAKENQAHSVLMGKNGSGAANGHYGYSTKKLYPGEELRSRLVELGIPRNRHNLAELGEMLPYEIGGKFLDMSKGSDSSWSVYYTKNSLGAIIEPTFIEDQGAITESDARAKMLIYLIENKLLKV